MTDIAIYKSFDLNLFANADRTCEQVENGDPGVCARGDFAQKRLKVNERDDGPAIHHQRRQQVATNAIAQ